jgi:hypothetical protein
VADYDNIRPGDYVALKLFATGISGTGALTGGTVPLAGTVKAITHVKNGIGAGGGTGGDAPAGQGIQSGGGGGGGSFVDTNTGGTILGDLPAFNAPTAQGSPQSGWTTGANGIDSDGSYATAASANLRHSYGTFGFSVPNTNTITGIEVKLEGAGTTAAGEIQVRLSWDGGTALGDTKTTGTLTATDAVYTIGSPSDTWGHSWTPSETVNGAFSIELISQPSGNTVKVDAIRVRIYHQSSGGGGGGGGVVYVPAGTSAERILELIKLLGISIPRYSKGVVSYR